jgi:hypothetical protein
VWRDIVSYVVGCLILAGITAIIMFIRKFSELPKQMIVVTAALFRVLRSNKYQGVALQKIAMALKNGCTNGEAEDATKAVITDQEKTDTFLRRAALARPENLADLLKEQE